MQNVIFIAGTDTGVGKTVITKLLARHLYAKGCDVVMQKWVETGVIRSSAIFKFKLAASPHLAAKRERRKISIARIKSTLRKASHEHALVLVEGTGGLMVPVTEKILLIDIVKELDIPVLLICANRLGAINHTLLSLEALKTRKMKVLGIVFNTISNKEDNLILKDNPRVVKKFIGKVPVWINGLRKI